MPRALRELGDAAARSELIAAADHGETVLAERAAFDAVPNWVDVTPGGFAAPVEHDYLSGYDANRVQLYLVWSRNAEHAAVKRSADMMARADLAGHVAVMMTLAGEVQEQSNFAGYTALAELATCRHPEEAEGALHDQPYYPATLELLTILASREGSACKP
ncbi:glycosyl hydrolase family 8 [Sulfitobacter guttiformis]|uniref:glycosyl hydrolase family 8 n=1 Tax=Sulfitobacter guttiformis TaxID=74349 RepID=UPI00046A7632|nr:glycosyl hydrolase family 8 [Sulfitobacter guttiformis]KIN72601.1 Cellulase [Sulfitobacter guttiformis KCTC 32187]